MASSVVSRTAPHTYASEFIRRELVSDIHTRVPALTLFAGKAGSDGQLGRPGSNFLVGGRGMRMKSQRLTKAGSTAYQVRVQTGTTGGGKHMAYNDTTASTGSDNQTDNVQSAFFKWSMWQQPIRVPKMLLRVSGGRFRIANAIEESTAMAMEEVFEQLGTEIYTGDPAASESDEIWPEMHGLQSALDTTGDYGGLDHSTTGWTGKKVTSAKSPSLSLIDDANLEQKAAEKTNGVDIALTTMSIYNTLKQEAITRNAVLTQTQLAQRGQLGFLREAIEYNGVLITFDPKCPASHLFCLNSKTFLFELHGGENFRVTKFRDASDDGAPGEDDALTAKINVMYRFICEKPGANVMYTNVS